MNLDICAQHVNNMVAVLTTVTIDFVKNKCWHWNCSSRFCKNSWRSEESTYYTLTWIEKVPKNAEDTYQDVIGKSKVTGREK